MGKNVKRRAGSLTRGVVGAGAATAVLLGGFGAFALWSDDADLGVASTITTGSLDLDVAPGGSWVLTNPGGQTGSPVAIADIAQFVASPGDVLEFTTGAVSGTVTGSDIEAELAVDSGSYTLTGLSASDVLFDVDVAGISVNGTPLASGTTTITGTETGAAITGTATVTVAFDETSMTGVIGQNGQVDLTGLSLLLEQQ